MEINGPGCGRLQAKCQIHDVAETPFSRLSSTEAAHWICRIRRIVKRRFHYVINVLAENRQNDAAVTSHLDLRQGVAVFSPGDNVKIRSKEEIQATLDRWNRLKGCSFMEEMAPYCGTTQYIFKSVNKFLDERDYRIKKCKGIYLLKDLFCRGTRDYGECDRSCLYFWREEWLEKIDGADKF